MKQKYKFIKVITSTIYAFKDGEVNGWTPEEVIEDWFGRYHPDQKHASRDAYNLGGSTVIQEVEIINDKQFKEYEKEIKTQIKKIEEKRKPKPYLRPNSMYWPIDKVIKQEGD